MNKLFLAGLLLLGSVAISNATIIDFDDLPAGTFVPSGYAGLTWGTSTESSYYGDLGSFAVSPNDYANSNSSPNAAVNFWGVNNLWFSFTTPVTFKGAWFANPYNILNASGQVRFRDNLGKTSSWLILTETPQYLVADFSNSQTVYIERAGGNPGDNGASWYTIDDITFNQAASPIPEPSTFILLSAGLGGFAILRRRMNKVV